MAPGATRSGPTAGDILIAVATVTVVALAGWVVPRDVDAPSTGYESRVAAPATPSPAAEPSSPPQAETTSPPAVAVIGDGLSAGTGAWPAALAQSAGVEVDSTSAAVGEGYVGAGGAGTFQDAAATLADPDVVVVFGSRADSRSTGKQVQAAATALYGRIVADHPQARVVVIGPAWPTWARPAGDPDAARAGVRAAAKAAGLDYVDPQADGGWFTRDNRALIGPDRATPTAPGAQYLSGKVEAALAAAGISLDG